VPCKQLTTRSSAHRTATTSGVKKHYDLCPRTTALHDQKSTELLIRKHPFQSLVLEIARLISVSNHPLYGFPRTNRGIPVLSL